MGEEYATTECGIQGYLKATISRAQLLTAAGAGLAMAALPGAAAAAGSPQRLEYPFFPKVRGTYTTENLQDILNLLETFEMFFVTAGTFALTDLAGQVKDPLLTYRQARAAVGQYHIDYLESLGARPLITTFTPRGRNQPGSNQISAALEGDVVLMIGVYITAVREFAELGQPMLAKNAAQALGTWSELRGIVRSSAGVTPALNKAFESDLFLYLRDYYKLAVENKQFENSGVSLSGLRLTYPGRDAVLAAAGPMAGTVVQKTPNNAIVSTSYATLVTKGFNVLTGERGDTP